MGHRLEPRTRTRPLLTAVAVLVFLLFFNGVSTIKLFDSYRVKQVPFYEQWPYLKEVMRGDQDLLQPPGR